MKVLFVLPVKGGGGGAHSVVQEAEALAKMGVSTKIAVNDRNLLQFQTLYAATRRVAFEGFANTSELGRLMSDADLVVATIYTSVDLIMAAKDSNGCQPKLAYYVQDYEPLFAVPNSDAWQQAFSSYSKFANGFLFAKTRWLQDTVASRHDGVEVHKVTPSINHDIYFPNLARPVSKAISVCAMIRSATPRRAPYRTARVVSEIAEKYGQSVRVHVFGTRDSDLARSGIELASNVINYGVLTRQQVATVLRESDLFLDLSDYQAFGRTGLEGMACGCVPVVPELGGASEYAVDGENGFMLDTRDEHQIHDCVADYFASDVAERDVLRWQAIATAQKYSATKAALSEYRLFANQLTKTG